MVEVKDGSQVKSVDDTFLYSHARDYYAVYVDFLFWNWGLHVLIVRKTRES